MKPFAIERRWTVAILDTIFPEDGASRLSPSIDDAQVEAYLDSTLSKSSAVAAFGLRAGFAAIAISPPVTVGKLCTIDRLEREDRVRVIERLYNAPFYHVRQLVVLAKATGAMLYCASPTLRHVMMGQSSEASTVDSDDCGIDLVAEGMGHVCA